MILKATIALLSIITNAHANSQADDYRLTISELASEYGLSAGNALWEAVKDPTNETIDFEGEARALLRQSGKTRAEFFYSARIIIEPRFEQVLTSRALPDDILELLVSTDENIALMEAMVRSEQTQDPARLFFLLALADYTENDNDFDVFATIRTFLNSSNSGAWETAANFLSFRRTNYDNPEKNINITRFFVQKLEELMQSQGSSSLSYFGAFINQLDYLGDLDFESERTAEQFMRELIRGPQAQFLIVFLAIDSNARQAYGKDVQGDILALLGESRFPRQIFQATVDTAQDAELFAEILANRIVETKNLRLADAYTAEFLGAFSLPIFTASQKLPIETLSDINTHAKVAVASGHEGAKSRLIEMKRVLENIEETSETISKNEIERASEELDARIKILELKIAARQDPAVLSKNKLLNFPASGFKELYDIAANASTDLDTRVAATKRLESLSKNRTPLARQNDGRLAYYYFERLLEKLAEGKLNSAEEILTALQKD